MNVLSTWLAAWLVSAALLPSLALGQPGEEPPGARAARLAQDPHWLRLIHHATADDRSELRSAAFFLSPQGERDALAELQATLAAIQQPVEGNPDEHARCRYPARSAWLASRWPLSLPPLHCPRYEDWSRLGELRSISLIMVSGYFGNPASSFGHTLLRLNHHGEAAGGRLLDLSVNFGARVPPNEPMVAYIAKGLLGGYSAGYTEGPYFLQDQVYVHTEYRDLWEYDLALDAAERETLAAHLWELGGQDFLYYFLTRNCAYRLAELLTLATGAPYTPAARLWYTPVELFHGLMADTGRPAPLVNSVRFVPSSQRQLYAQFRRLDPQQQQHVNQLIAQPAANLGEALAALLPQQRLEVIDTLAAYYEYRLAAFPENGAPPALRAAKDQLLRARLALPARVQPLPVPAPLPDPTTGARGQALGLGLVHDGDEGALLWRYAPYLQDLLGRHRAGFAEIAVLEGTGRLTEDHLRLDRLDLLRLRKLAAAPGIAGESQLSWRVRAGLGRPLPLPATEANTLHAQLGGGLGRAMTLGETLLVHAGVDGLLESSRSPLRAGPSFSLATRGEGLRMGLEVLGAYDVRRTRWQPQAQLDLGMALARDLEWRVGVGHAASREAVTLELRGYW